MAKDALLDALNRTKKEPAGSLSNNFVASAEDKNPWNHLKE
jgi:hypothetical protein